MLLGGIDAGGTKINCAVAEYLSCRPKILERIKIKTNRPAETIPKILRFFASKQIDALGIGCFGPIDLHINSATYGFITTTPKLDWRDYNILGQLEDQVKVPVGFDTDVNGAALAEFMWGRAKGVQSCVYLTVGTGIGGGAIIDRKLVHGLLHPEMGHIMPRRHHQDHFKGICPHHGDCLEGLASGPAIEKRTGMKGEDLQDKSAATWEIISNYLAQAVVNCILILSPQKVILGGGVMKHDHLFPIIRNEVKQLMNSYLPKEELLAGINDYIVYPGLGEDAGLFGGFALAIQALNRKDRNNLTTDPLDKKQI